MSQKKDLDDTDVADERLDVDDDGLNVVDDGSLETHEAAVGGYENLEQSAISGDGKK